MTDGNVALPLATVATSGNYNDLSNRPSIPNGSVVLKFQEKVTINNIHDSSDWLSVYRTVSGLTPYKPLYVSYSYSSHNSSNSGNAGVHSGCLPYTNIPTGTTATIRISGSNDWGNPTYVNVSVYQ